MKKDLIFAPILVLIGALLGMLDWVGMPAHIAVSVLGIFVLAVYTSLTKKEWKIPALEILMRLFYGVALITGIVLMNVEGIAALAIAHKVSAVLFVVLDVVLFVIKLATKKRK
ncbi:MAG: hypothetical protein IKW18_01810 [Clostridia bacterium]|nr:hypothetical protein [Clostridia bacterium]